MRISLEWKTLICPRSRSDLSVILLFLFSIFCPAVLAGENKVDGNNVEFELQKLLQKIDTIQKGLQVIRGRRDGLQTNLRTVERRIAQRSRSLRKLDRKLKKQKQKLLELEDSKRKLLAELKIHRKVLKEQINAAYAMGRQEYLKLVLNQQHPAIVGRVMAYYDYLNQARMEVIQIINIKVAEVQELTEQIKAQQEKLLVTRKNIKGERQNLKGIRQDRKTVIANLDKDIRNREKELFSYRENVQRLERLISGIQEVVRDISPAETTSIPFTKLKGRLAWPTNGKVLSRYGSSRRIGRLRWQGIVIGAAEGAEVKAIASGRVVFADWLRGFGLLLIIEHGNDFMSLYGYNQHLLKQTGDWVEIGESIASVGDSGGQTRSGLYFEIRRQGKPVNPMKWLAIVRNK
ncbi:MAG: murein hydrolase activator EnvC [Gammaproteobacteria bacterium]|nr:MAG: murein hydrolase activator EnvC [Gammaproteobacteria bacterium]